MGVFIDTNLEPRIAEFPRKEGYPAEYSDYVLDEDADDEDDILRCELLRVAQNT